MIYGLCRHMCWCAMCMGVQMHVSHVCRLDLLCIHICELCIRVYSCVWGGHVCTGMSVYGLDVPVYMCELGVGMPLALCLYVSAVCRQHGRHLADARQCVSCVCLGLSYVSWVCTSVGVLCVCTSPSRYV